MAYANEPRKEYALRIDCEKNGCETPHRDNGSILPCHRLTVEHDLTHQTANGHACTVMSRVIPAWTEDPDYFKQVQ